MVTSTGVGLRSGTTRIVVTLPMVTPSSVTGAPLFKSRRILEVGAKHQFLCEYASRRGGHQEDEQDKNGNGRQDQCANSELRPLNLFAAWQSYSP